MSLPIADDLGAHVAAARRGDRRAFAELYRRFARAVHGVVLARVSYRDADDLVQDVFALALERLPQLAEPAAFPGWLMAIARHRAIDHARARRLPADGGDELDGVAAPSGTSSPTAPLDARRVLAALRALPDAYHEPLILRLVEGMSGPEIAAHTGLQPGSVRVNLHRGMKLLRAALGLGEETDDQAG